MNIKFITRKNTWIKFTSFNMIRIFKNKNPKFYENIRKKQQ